MHKKSHLLALIAFTFSVSAFADIYKRVDADGRITYTNIPSKEATRLDFDPDARTIDNNRPRQPGNLGNKRTASPDSFPKIDKQTQNNRDGKRKEILKNELDAEKKALMHTKQAYIDIETNSEISKNSKGQANPHAPKFQEKMKALQVDIDNHQNNIKLLQKELDALRLN